MRFVFVALILTLSLQADVPAQETPVFPQDFCGSLPALDAAAQERLAAEAPEFAGVPAKVLDPQGALLLLAKAVEGNWSSLQLFTQDAIRQDCAVVLGAETLDAIRGAYELFLITPLAGSDSKGRPFKAVSIVFGKGHVRIDYDRAAFRHSHVHFDESFFYQSPIRMQTPETGMLRLKGITGPFGLTIDAMRLEGDNVVVQAGPFTRKRSLRRIRPVETAPAAEALLATPPAIPERIHAMLAPGALEASIWRP